MSVGPSRSRQCVRARHLREVSRTRAAEAPTLAQPHLRRQRPLLGTASALRLGANGIGLLEAQGAPLMSKHVTISPTEAGDRLAIRELVEAHSHCADRRDAKGQMALFTEDAHFVVYMDAKDPNPTQELHGRESLAPVFADLNKYAATMHLLGQSTILTLSNDRATGEVYCMPHHLTIDGTKRSLMIAALRYADTYVKRDGVWLYAERRLYVDWIEERPLS